MHSSLKALLLLSLLLTGCSGSLVSRANSPHQLKAHWKLRVYELGAGFQDFDLTVFEKKEAFRVQAKTKVVKVPNGPFQDVAYDILYLGGDQLYKIYADGHARSCAIKDPSDLARFRFWRVADIDYTEAGQDMIGSQQCTKYTVSGQGFGGINLDQTLWISQQHGYLCKNTVTSGGEPFGTQIECDQIQAYPSYPAGIFDPPANPEKSSEMLRAW